jgi:hypothetical protein
VSLVSLRLCGGGPVKKKPEGNCALVCADPVGTCHGKAGSAAGLQVCGLSVENNLRNKRVLRTVRVGLRVT